MDKLVEMAVVEPDFENVDKTFDCTGCNKKYDYLTLFIILKI